MTDPIERAIRRLGKQLPDLLSRPGDQRYDGATAIWAKPVRPMPRAVAHCESREDVQATILAAYSPSSRRGRNRENSGT